ncbi:helix-turn-helix transcriptional regulator [Nocardioides cavernae]|uniref:Helix-turn-helix transcriptional regulator n=2 Tax=Nocardioides cavernae TaxID=1921566 RepID=A0ABR8N840_9ACTN|nr:helix-turn-helix transcriptional regulator [Nocardioides cavernae]MBM7510750.1 transcriptional regulator with XRE-family HTH domain [Nocardioides cavernae]
MGLSLADLSARVDLSPFTINSYERGRRLPSLEALDVVARALDTDVRELLAGVFPWDGGAEAPGN